MAKTTAERIDHILEVYQGAGFRKHLGASIIGKECSRALWYTFRWALRANFKGRILRLFNRGHREEEALADFMRKAGIHVLTADPKTGKQFRIEDHDGHFGGSMDAKLYDTPELPKQWLLGEFKTHGEKSFKKIKAQGIKKAKPEYWAQAQIYMAYDELPACLHFNVNKNTDELYVEYIEPEEELVERMIDKAHKIIFSEIPPARIPNASPAWFICRWCDFKEVCHNGAPKTRNCRTCVSSSPVEDGKWFCGKFHVHLDYHAQLRGCQEFKEIPELD